MKRNLLIGAACSLMLTSGAAFAQSPVTSLVSSLTSGSPALSSRTGGSGLQSLLGGASLTGGSMSNGSRGISGDETGNPLADSLRQGVSNGLAKSIRYDGGVLATSIHNGVGNGLSNSEQDTVDSLRIGLDESGGSALSALLYQPGDQRVRKLIKYDAGFTLGRHVRSGSNRLSYLIEGAGQKLSNGIAGSRHPVTERPSGM